jgi:hypothetical protein
MANNTTSSKYNKTDRSEDLTAATLIKERTGNNFVGSAHQEACSWQMANI